MLTVIEQAMAGKKKALQSLYRGSRQSVYFISYLLANSEAEAVEITTHAYRNAWREMASHGITTEEFAQLVVRKAVDYCKSKRGKKNAKLFWIPPHKNFLFAGDVAQCDLCESVVYSVTKTLPILQRYIFVLDAVAEYQPEQIAEVFKFDVKTINLALAVQDTNVERILRLLEENESNYMSFLRSLEKEKQESIVPSTVDESVKQVIDQISKPYEQAKRRLVTTAAGGILALGLLIAGVSVVISGDSGKATFGDTGVTEGASTTISSPVIELDELATYYADIAIQDYGTITVELDQVSAPVTVSNFVNLAQNGFYDGLTFHRVIESFMMQGGDPNGDGSGGSGVNIVGEFTNNGYENTLSHTRGAISMARADAYDSASSQFFIVHQDSSVSLDGDYAVFGYVTEGMEIVDAICEAAEPIDENGSIASEEQPIISSIVVRTE